MRNDVHLGHKARKRFGQNFLNDPYIIDGIVSAINPKPGQNLVEIGPGLGAITEPVGREVDKFTVIELDRDLAERLRTHPELADKLTIHEGDAMRFDFTQLVKPNNKLRIFGNLPYNISTPLMFHLFMEHVKQILDSIDQAIKRLVSSVAMLVGAALLGNGLDKPETSEFGIYFLMILLSVGAVGYMFFSGREAINTFIELSISRWKVAILAVYFMLIYLVLCIAAVRLGFDKLPTA